jgi:hypothetical protein
VRGSLVIDGAHRTLWMRLGGGKLRAAPRRVPFEAITALHVAEPPGAPPVVTLELRRGTRVSFESDGAHRVAARLGAVRRVSAIGVGLALLLVADVARGEEAGALRERIVGAWRLVSVEDRRADGALLDRLGPRPVGLLVYGAEGALSLQMARRERAAPGAVAGDAATARIVEAYAGYVAYFGTWSLDAERGVIVHRIEGGLVPGHEGQVQERAFALDGDRLVLRASWRHDGAPITSTVTWERAR